jgi:hypothetical protein
MALRIPTESLNRAKDLCTSLDRCFPDGLRSCQTSQPICLNRSLRSSKSNLTLGISLGLWHFCHPKDFSQLFGDIDIETHDKTLLMR